KNQFSESSSPSPYSLVAYLLPQPVFIAYSPASRRPVIAHAPPCPAFTALPRTCSNLEEDYNLSIENILAKTLSDSPNEKEKRITTFTVQLAKASIGYGMLNWLHL
ncbi:hypothetical protein S245_005278, partial [Arachis hypogaea]